MFIKIGFKILHLLSKLPLKLLYSLSSIIYIILVLLQYRKEVILKNLSIVFPNKTVKEKNKIKKAFYKNFSDYFIEVILTLSATPKEMVGKRVDATNLNLFKEAKQQNKEVFIISPHVFNWEWIAFLANSIPQENVYGIYKPIKNKVVNKEIEAARFRTGGKGLSTKEVYTVIDNGITMPENAYVFFADQSPKKEKIKNYISFFNRKTPVFTGYDDLIRKKNAAVFYCAPLKVKQGKYIFRVEKILPDAKTFVPNEVVEKFYKKLEQTIIENPSNWLWSHKRWKE